VSSLKAAAIGGVPRTAPFNRITVQHLKRAGIESLIKPVLQVLPLQKPTANAVPDALVLTSLNGVRLHRFRRSLSTLPVFAVGDHSARFARLRGYRSVTSASGDVQDLRRQICSRIVQGADILHLGAVHPAGDFAALLRSDGYRVRRICVYDIAEASLATLDQVAPALPHVGTILVHSPRAGRHVAAWLRRNAHDWSGHVCCISEVVAEAFENIPNVRTVVAERPDEAALMAAAFALHGSGYHAGRQQAKGLCGQIERGC
jgi:uroporphyrinogen-III synthase